MPDVALLLTLVPLLPVMGALLACVCGAFGNLRKFAHVPVLLGTATAFACALGVVSQLPDHQYVISTASVVWFGIDTFQVNLGLTADTLSAAMMLIVTFIGSWIVLFSVGYMHGSPGYPRYFAVVGLFIGSMLLLVLGNNFLTLFAGWEGVGLCSYLLVGYWYHKPSAADAARKAFLVTRLGDVGLIIGIFLLWFLTGKGSLDFSAIFLQIDTVASKNSDWLSVAALFIFLGCVGKSAQFPLYVWLPDAMEGPTPVSALIHAATMVTAGVYLLARCAPLYVLCPDVQLYISVTGGLTAIVAAFIALTQHDLKRVLAYSTVSQLGFMFMALGCSGVAIPSVAVTAAIFHLGTHAFFKALLFLSAGSVMHAMHDTIDMRMFSGLRKVLPVTHLSFLIGGAALAGLPLLSGFWSKDMILEALWESSHDRANGSWYLFIFIVAITTAFLTAFYTFRAYFLTFWGEEKMPEGSHPHETAVMNIPLLVLAVGALVVGGIFGGLTQWFEHFLEKSPVLVQANAGQTAEHHWNWPLMIGSSAVALLGVVLAWFMYVKNPATAKTIAKNSGTAYELSLNRLYVDEIYQAIFVKPFEALGKLCRGMETVVFDTVRLLASFPQWIGEAIRPLQNGLVQFYALTMAMGVAAFIAYLVLFAK